MFHRLTSYLKLVEHSVTEEEEVNRADEAEASGEGNQEVGEKPILGYHRDTGYPGADVVLSIHRVVS